MAEVKQQEQKKLTVGSWVAEARLQDITYHRTRKQLWGKFAKLVKRGAEIDKELFKSIKGVLTSRSQELDDNKKLAFETALDQLEEDHGAEADDSDDDADDAAPAAPAPKSES